MDLDDLWKVFEKQSIENNYIVECAHELDMCGTTCIKCGLVLYSEYQSQFNQEEIINLKKPFYRKYKKYNLWYKWTNEEKNLYSIEQYTKSICKKLEVDTFIDFICDLVKIIMILIKKNDCSKRNHLKIAIIILCIVHVLPQYTVTSLSKKIELNIKYITKAEKNIKELLLQNKLQLSHLKHFETKNDHVTQLIDYCKKNDIIQEHSPKSIYAVCTFFIAKKNDSTLSINKFVNCTDISTVTISKIYKKLKSKIVLN